LQAGSALASAVADAPQHNTNAKVVFLKNHGVVIDGDNVSEISQILNQLIIKFSERKIKLDTYCTARCT
jgi:hypothetical protein